MRFEVGTRLRCVNDHGSTDKLKAGETYYCIGGPTERETYEHAIRVYVSRLPGGERLGNASGWNATRFEALGVAGPHTKGVYKVNTSTGQTFFSYWNGEKWGWVDSSAKGAWDHKDSGTGYWNDVAAVSWRPADAMDIPDIPAKKRTRAPKVIISARFSVKKRRLLLL